MPKAVIKIIERMIAILLFSLRASGKIEFMKMDFGLGARFRPAILAAGLLMAALSTSRAAEISWDRAGDSLACKLGDQTLWRFSFGANYGKPFFHPLSLAGGDSLTGFKPSDHPWHYGLWFSWKYINGINYWEEDKTGKAQGATRWEAPEIMTRPDGSADIQMNLRYPSPTNTIWMTERRRIRVSKPDADGGVVIDWSADFTALGHDDLLLDRTPMPGEAHGAVNGGYAGLSARLAPAPAKCQFLTTDGPVDQFASDRARPASSAAACNITQKDRTDGIAIFSKDPNSGGKAPWYIINAPAMRWFSPALLSPAPRKVKARESFTWNFRIITKKGLWTPEKLTSANREFQSVR
jgi:hypothetical protein